MAIKYEQQPIFDRALVASHLANGDRSFVRWISAPWARASLQYKTYITNGVENRLYKLTEVNYGEQDRKKGKAYIFFADNGQLAGVLNSELEVDDEGMLTNRRELTKAMEFQIQNGLSEPLEEDEIALDRLLESALDNPSLTEVPLE